MFIRIVTGIARHFEARVIEWAMAAIILWWGIILVGENDALVNKAAWANMLALWDENTWGWVAVIIGTARLLALAINGTFGNTIYSRLSPYVRAGCAGVGAWLWLNVFLSVTAVATSGSGIYPLPLALDVWCLFHAAYEAGQTRARRNGVA